VRRYGDDVVGFVQLVAVAPGRRRSGVGREVVATLQEWAFDEHGARAMAVGGCAPYYLWPGVDAHMTPALCLFEALGYRPRGAELNMAFSARHRAPAPAGVAVRRVIDDEDAGAAVEFCRSRWPNWVAELQRAVDHGSCLVAVEEATGALLGFGCHSVNRLGWLGPMATEPGRQHGGVGNALLGAIATDVMAAGLSTVEVAWVGPVRFYAKAAGATVSRAFRTLTLPRA
ncbi:MAG TPA: GNAT family N-acetyltransferase, partial [Acidimicrobiales bacterium]|nr:GNAT family N-acetyltransferase [Acidimicrobiales bacterium]